MTTEMMEVRTSIERFLNGQKSDYELQAFLKLVNEIKAKAEIKLISMTKNSDLLYDLSTSRDTAIRFAAREKLKKVSPERWKELEQEKFLAQRGHPRVPYRH